MMPGNSRWRARKQATGTSTTTPSSQQQAPGGHEPSYAIEDTTRRLQVLTTQSDFQGLGLQHSGSGAVRIGRDLVVGGQGHHKPNRKPFSTVPFRPDSDFIDRPELLAWVHEKCAQPAARAALIGLGGIGKSQIAIHYCHTIRRNSPQTWVFWVHASTRARFEEAYRGIADRLELQGRSDPKTNILQLVLNWLSDEENGQWVMVLDNVDDSRVFFPDAIRPRQQVEDESTPLATYVPQSSNGRILLTSRDRDAALRLTGDLENVREVKTMDEDLALQLLRKKLKPAPDQDDAVALVHTLQCIPIAITQAAAYINQRESVTVQSYLKDFHKSDKKKTYLLRKDIGDLRRDASASHSVITTWQISFERIRETRPSAADLLSLMSCFNPQGIPRAVLRSDKLAVITDGRSSTESDEDSDCATEFDDDAEVLKAFCLISETTNGMLEMHALVQFCTRIWLSEFGTPRDWEDKFLTLMSREFPPGEYENWAKCQQLLPHLVPLYEVDSAGSLVAAWADLMTNVAWYMWRTGYFEQAYSVAIKAVQIREKHGGGDADHSMQQSTALLALIMRQRGNYEDAEEMQRQLLKIRREEFGNRHPATLINMSNLALVLRDRYKYEEAEKIDRWVLKVRQEKLGGQHPDVLLSMNNLAVVLQNRGEHDEAEELSRRHLKGSLEELGDQHPFTLMGMRNLAFILHSQRKYEDAEQLYRQALKGMQVKFGDQHPDTLLGMDHLAMLLMGRGEYGEAEELARRSLQASLEKLGHQHPYTLMRMRNLALILEKQRKYEEADELYQRASKGGT